MVKKLSWVVLFLAMSSLRAVLAQTGPSDAAALIDEALRLSGIENTLRQIPLLTQNKVAEYEGLYEVHPPAKAFAALRPTVKESFQVNALYASVKASVGKNPDRERLLALLKGLRSPLVRKMAQLEAQASTPEAFRQKGLFEAEMIAKPPAPARKASIERLDKAAGATDLKANQHFLVAFRSRV